MKVKLYFIGNMLHSNRVLLNRCAIWCRSFDEYSYRFKMYGFDYDLLNNDIMSKLWLHFEICGMVVSCCQFNTYYVILYVIYKLYYIYIIFIM